MEKTQTVMIKQISGSSLWCHWDYSCDTFYHIIKKAQPTTPLNPHLTSSILKEQQQQHSCDTDHDPHSFYLECLKITPANALHVYRYTLPLPTTGHMSSSQLNVQTSIGQCCVFPHDTQFDFQLVRLRNNVDVLCRQQPHPVKPLTDIVITVYMLYHQQTRKFTIRVSCDTLYGEQY